MKHILLFVAVIICSSNSVSAITRTSIINGAWSSPTTWSPAGIPSPADDSIIVNTSVTFNQTIGLGSTEFWITAAGSLMDMANDTIAFGGDFMIVDGYLSVSMFVPGANNSVSNNGQIDVIEMAQSGTFNNQTGGSLCVTTMLATSDVFINDGDVSCGTWVNGAVVSGNGGQFCIAGNFINSDQIGGSIDICDASPGGFGDVNMGTIAISVTTCQAGPCAVCVTSSIEEANYSSLVKISPNPILDQGVLEVISGNTTGSYSFTVLDVSGRMVKSIIFSGSQLYFDRAGMETGIYIFQLVSQEGLSTNGKFIVQ